MTPMRPPRIDPCRRPRQRRAVAAILIALVALPPSPTVARTDDRLPGPIHAEVIRVIDGDSLLVRVGIWIDQIVTVSVRLRGVDAPELRADCPAERGAARRAKLYLTAAIRDDRVILRDIESGVYHGRVLADVATLDGRNLSDGLLQAGLAVPYRRPQNPGAEPDR